jgi:hypothetical protein
MPKDFPFREENNELNESSLEAVRNQCLEEVTQAIEDLEALIEAGVTPKNDEPEEIARTVAALASYAFRHEDSETVDRCVDVAVALPTQASDEKFPTYLTGIFVGNERALMNVEGQLEAEKLNLEQKFQNPGTTARNISRQSLNTKLYYLAEVWAQQGNDPTNWINEFSVNNLQAFTLELRSAYSLSEHYKDGSLEAKMAADQRLNDTIQRLLTDEFPADFLDESLRTALAYAKDDQLRGELVDQYLERMSTRSTVTWNQCRNHIAVANDVVKNPALATPERITVFEREIDYMADAFAKNGKDQFAIHKATLWWRINLGEHSNATPAEVIENIDLQVAKMLSGDIREEPTPGDAKSQYRNKHSVVLNRDHILATFAEKAASKQDFAAANLYTANINDEITRKEALTECLIHATTPEQLATLRPDGLTLLFNPELNLQLRLAEARCTQDVETALTYIDEMIANRGDTWEIKFKVLETTYRQLGSRPEVAARIAQRLRQNNIPVATQHYFSQELLVANDPDEPRQLYAQLDQWFSNKPLLRLRRLLSLTEALEETE